eukprot:scaffold113282_cov57-Phaeocystis_antarctica.AAC.2
MVRQRRALVRVRVVRRALPGACRECTFAALLRSALTADRHPNPHLTAALLCALTGGRHQGPRRQEDGLPVHLHLRARAPRAVSARDQHSAEGL